MINNIIYLPRHAKAQFRNNSRANGNATINLPVIE